MQVTTQTQPGLPVTSTPDAELRGASRVIFVKELIELDFGIECQKPRMWTDSSSAMQAAKRIGPGSKLRHLEVCEFYVHGALHAKKIGLAKVKGTINCANFLTKHPKSGVEVRQALPSLGMYEPAEEEDVPSQAKRINVKIGSVTQAHGWKAPKPHVYECCAGTTARNPSKVAIAGSTAQAPSHTSAKVSTIKAAVFLSQTRAVAAQDDRINHIILIVVQLLIIFLAGFGLADLLLRIYLMIQDRCVRRGEPRFEWVEMHGEERDPDEIPGMFGVGTPMRRPSQDTFHCNKCTRQLEVSGCTVQGNAVP